MTDAPVIPQPPTPTELVQARTVLEALQHYLETPAGMAVAGSDFLDLHGAISLMSLAVERLHGTPPARSA